MAELHANQIAFQAGKTSKAKFAAPQENNIIGDALLGFADLANRAAEEIVKVEDNLLTQRLRSQMASGLQEIDDAKSLDADYSEVRNKVIGEFNNIIDGASEPAKRRLLQQYPTIREDMILAADAKVATKTGNQIFERLKNEIPRMSSEITTAPVDMQKQLYDSSMALLNNPNLSISQVEQLTSMFRGQVDNGLVLSAMAQNDWTTARQLLDNPEVTASLSAPDRMRYLLEIERGMKEEQKLMAEMETKKDSGQKERLQSEILQTYYNLLNVQKDPQSAELFRQQVFDGTPILDKQGNVMGSTAGWPAELVIGLTDKMEKIAKADPQLAYKKKIAQSEFNDITRPLLDKNGNIDIAKLTPDVYANMKKMKDDRYAFNYLLTDTMQTALNEIDNYPAAVRESYIPTDQFAMVPVVRSDNPGGYIENIHVSPIGNTAELMQKYIDTYGAGTMTPSGMLEQDKQTKTSVASALAEVRKRGFLTNVQDGTRAGALAALLIGVVSTDNQSAQKSLENQGIINVSTDNVISAVLQTIGELQNARLANDDASGEAFQEDYNRVYQLSVGYPNRPTEEQKKIQNGVMAFALSATLYPKSVDTYKYKNSSVDIFKDVDKDKNVLYPQIELRRAFNVVPNTVPEKLLEQAQKDREKAVKETLKNKA